MEDSIINIIKMNIGKRTNCYLFYNDVCEKIFRGEWDYCLLDKFLLVIEKNDGYYNMYFFGEFPDDSKAIYTINDFLNKYNTIVFSQVKERECADENGWVYKVGFFDYKKYIRKKINMNELKEYRELLLPTYAKESDFDKIRFLMNDTFDAYADYIPNHIELIQLIKSRSILKIECDNNLAGFLIFENKGKISYARMLCVREEYRNSFVGYSLFARYVNMHINRMDVFYLWVDTNNESVSRLHDNFNYVDDGTENRIMIRRNK